MDSVIQSLNNLGLDSSPRWDAPVFLVGFGILEGQGFAVVDPDVELKGGGGEGRGEGGGFDLLFLLAFLHTCPIL